VVKRLWRVCSLVLVGLLSVGGPSQAQEQPLRLLGEYDIPARSLRVDGTTVGGLSGLTYDAGRDVYYVISDDRGEYGPPRFYTVKLDVGPAGIREVRFLGVTVLDSDASTPGIQPHDTNQSDTEDIVLLPDDTLVVSSERDRNDDPWLRHFTLDGSLLGEITLPDVFMPAWAPDAQGNRIQTRGVRSNLALEAVAWAPTESALYTINEEALRQDGPPARTNAGTVDRLLRFSWSGGQATPGRQTVYRTEPVFATSVPADQPADNGVSALVWIRDVLPAFDFLILERAFATGVGNDVNLYGLRVGDADDVASLEALPKPFEGRTMDKSLLVNMAAIGIKADNLEGMSLGPRLADGGIALILIADDNFSNAQTGQFLAFEVGRPTAE
jgi:hypothetical protein